MTARYSGNVHGMHVLTFHERGSESRVVERIWTARSERAGVFSSIASPHWEMVVTRRHDTTSLTVRGPETKATEAQCPADGEWVAIRFRAGTYWPECLPATLRDRRDLTLPPAARPIGRSSALELPRRSFERVSRSSMSCTASATTTRRI